ncbi:antitoxin [Nocardia suismassiliense]|uniref:Antitoxin n=1 Tax=Nocardia suismassiliense TaxID=2077092 RepID=A0ABW6QLR7_9NOCA|nr:antitoxin [Nocardia sp. CS682]QBS41645.1 antitoxin [Nocardia sp. CS682]
MRTTIDIDAVVLEQLRRRAKREGKTLGQLVSELLARALAEDEQVVAADIAWPSTTLGLRVDIEDKHALYAALDVDA